MTDEEIVDKCNRLAGEYYAMHGYRVMEGYRFDRAHHPQEKLMWEMACNAFKELLLTDPEDALSGLEE